MTGVRRSRPPRIIAGTAGGRRLVVPPGVLVRPTSDRVRESVFAALGDARIVGRAVLDLYAGSGALGLEALSRGADRAIFVERDGRAGAAVAANVAALGFPDRAELRPGDVAAVLAGGRPGGSAPLGLVFCDPPYELASDALDTVLAGLVAPGGFAGPAGFGGTAWLAADATLVVERPAGAREPRWPAPWGSTWERCYGDTLVWFAEAGTVGEE